MTNKSYDPRWDIPLKQKDPNRPRSSLRQDLIRSGNADFDPDKLLCSEYGQKLIEGLEPLFLSEDPMSPEILSYWKQRGLKKERIWGGPEHWNYWVIFTPLSAFRPENKDRTYPLVFGIHGGFAGEFEGESVFVAESTGYARKAAEEEFILAMPEDHDTPAIMALYYHMIEHYPVDPSRVYLTGFSAGGDRSCRAALRHPELFAGILVGAGLPFNLIDDPKEIENAEKYKIPLITVGCLADKGNHTPFYCSRKPDNPVPEFIARLLTGEGKIMWINRFFRINHIDTHTLEENMEYTQTKGTEAEKRIGLIAHRSKTWKWAEKVHYCLDYTDKDGIDIVRYIFIEDMPHFEPVNMMDLAWPYLKRFSRNPDGSLNCSSSIYEL